MHVETSKLLTNISSHLLCLSLIFAKKLFG